MHAQPPSAAVQMAGARPGLRARASFDTADDLNALGALEVGSHVLCRGRQGGPHVGTVVGHRTAASGERYLLCRWYYRPEESAEGRRPFDGCSELLESDHVDIVPRNTVLSRCRVVSAGEFAREREVQIAVIRSAREAEFFERRPATDASRVAAEPWRTTFGDSPTPGEVELLNVMHRMLRRVQAEVRPDECRRPLQNWLGPPNAAMDKEEFPAPPDSKVAQSRKTTLCPRVGTGGNISMLREVFYKAGGPNTATGDVLCPRLLDPEGSYRLVLDDDALRAENGFNYSLGLVCPRTAMDEKTVRQARRVLQNLYFCRRKLVPAAPAAEQRISSEQIGPAGARFNWIKPVRYCAATGQPENLDFPLRVCPLRNALVDPRYMHGARVVCARKAQSSSAGKSARGSAARAGRASAGRGRSARGGGRHKATPSHWPSQMQDEAVPRPRPRGDGRAPRVQQLSNRGHGRGGRGRVRGYSTGARSLAPGRPSSAAAAAGAPDDASSSEDTDDLSDDSDDSSDSSDDSSSISSDSEKQPGKHGAVGRKRAASSDDEDQASAPHPEPTDFELLEECELARVDCLVSPLYRKRKLMNMTEAKELLGMCINECKRQALETAKQADGPTAMQCNRVTGCEAGFFSFLWLMRGFEPTFLTAVRVCANGRVLWLASLVTPQLEDYDLVLSVELQAINTGSAAGAGRST